MLAFDRNDARKAGLINSVKSVMEGESLDYRLVNQAAIRELAEKHGLDPALALLIFAIAWPAAGSGRNMLAMLGAIPVGAEIRPVVHRFILWALSEIDLDLTAEMRGPAKAIAKLWGDALVTNAVARSDWRAARAAAMMSLPGDQVAASAIAAVAASAWDLDTVPGAAGDLVTAWLTLAETRHTVGLGWTEADSAQLDQAFDDWENSKDDVRPREPEAPIFQRFKEKRACEETASATLLASLRSTLIEHLQHANVVPTGA